MRLGRRFIIQAFLRRLHNARIGDAKLPFIKAEKLGRQNSDSIKQLRIQSRATASLIFYKQKNERRLAALAFGFPFVKNLSIY